MTIILGFNAFHADSAACMVVDGQLVGTVAEECLGERRKHSPAFTALVSAELARLLKPGGWLCARTPNKHCRVSLVTRLIDSSRHSRMLRWAEPERKEIDVFPTAFRLNSVRSLHCWFPAERCEHFSYRYEPEPGYFFNSRVVLFLNWLLPPAMKTNLFVFLRKR